ncbi:hypothetical protein BASA50_005481 [Batrachochytrium salamandrivorans]|uniref:THH1/TOM1/TOM3 domain-containing protein n=1 Tax=Batrachochytrium salamandrivorans TaxID=1357716 RepID=A0ABQ8FFR0_9FUNG|nr:hypothetical protein BASA62_005516 [Batrachochytrium salamandrivorans]KAH6584886.1 hypothetical protein BASA61_007254 [Batrachochytrium salamandrivorans]KAH6595901.1 hypothetical protein BASA50_005481 [Batrachochytrium salamandrivorans]KAH9273818.1 hypothetical protein BASA83_003812 [Batrachochytrium salamandrivorans]
MVARDNSAFATPSAIFLGIAIHELIYSFFFLVTATVLAWKTALFRISAAAWVFCVAQTCLQIVLVDFYISPYDISNNEITWVTIAALCANFLTSTALLVLMVIRLCVFHSGASPTLWMLSFLAVAAFCFYVPANAIGVLANTDVLAFRAQSFASSPLIGLVRQLFAISFAIQGIFTPLASISFLWSLCKCIGFTGRDFIYQVILMREGPRFFAIFGLNIIVAGFAVHSYIYGPTYVTLSAWFMPPMIYAIEIYTSLLISYVEPRSLLQKIQQSSSLEGLEPRRTYPTLDLGDDHHHTSEPGNSRDDIL